MVFSCTSSCDCLVLSCVLSKLPRPSSSAGPKSSWSAVPLCTQKPQQLWTNQVLSMCLVHAFLLHSLSFSLDDHVLSCVVLCCLVLSCLVLSCLVLSCLVLSCHVLTCLVMPCHVLSWLVLSWLVLSCLVLSGRVLSFLILSYYSRESKL
jgi:hypothetical protein